jgi:uncharacterized protein (DUF952 family)
LEDQTTALRRAVAQILSGPERERMAYESQFPARTIYHITPRDYYRSVPESEPYLPKEYAKDGFIHCTRGADLLALVANRFYRSVPGEFVMLVIDVPSLTSPLKYEALDPDTPLPFPHIYGPLNRMAIVDVVKMFRGEDGRFLVPPFDQEK